MGSEMCIRDSSYCASILDELEIAEKDNPSSAKDELINAIKPHVSDKLLQLHRDAKRERDAMNTLGNLCGDDIDINALRASFASRGINTRV